MVDYGVTVSQQRALVATSSLEVAAQSTAGRAGSCSHLCSALGRPHPEHWARHRALQFRADWEVLDEDLRRFLPAAAAPGVLGAAPPKCCRTSQGCWEERGGKDRASSKSKPHK